ncbi:hypothetical protein VCR15J2_390127 [Vibrio coralliirubri]|uniref:hypothetical protein n=1 Tax=Vibrio coralliirubri TaxID=1516159 RepID=UPI000638FBB6|nr:hypothetical protein [Vibrio coralliirubri]CDT54059.1 hypothetical protein VCR15J2_390127 [Vibrio coralliirubri]
MSHHLIVEHTFDGACRNCHDKPSTNGDILTSLSDYAPLAETLKGGAFDLEVQKAIAKTDTNEMSVFLGKYITTKFAKYFCYSSNLNADDDVSWELGVIRLETVSGGKIKEIHLAVPTADHFDSLITKWQSEFPKGAPVTAAMYFTKDAKEYLYFGINCSGDNIHRIVITKPDDTVVEIERETVVTPELQYVVSKIYGYYVDTDGVIRGGVESEKFQGKDAEIFAKAKYAELVADFDNPGSYGSLYGVSMTEGPHEHNLPGSKILIDSVNMENSQWIAVPSKTVDFDTLKSNIVASVATELAKKPTAPIEIEAAFTVKDLTKPSKITMTLTNEVYGISFASGELFNEG